MKMPATQAVSAGRIQCSTRLPAWMAGCFLSSQSMPVAISPAVRKGTSALASIRKFKSTPKIDVLSS
jgi:hypothetical protein